MKVLLLGDGKDDRGPSVIGAAGADLPEADWGPLHVLVDFLLRDLGITGFAFVRPLLGNPAIFNEPNRQPLNKRDRFRKQLNVFISTVLRVQSVQGLVVWIEDQDCEADKLIRLEDYSRSACQGIAEPLLLPPVVSVAVECTENWVLCAHWPVNHPSCLTLPHPKLLRCHNNLNLAKGVFDSNAVSGDNKAFRKRRDAAKMIVRSPQSTALKRLREDESFQQLEYRLLVTLL